MSLPLRLSNIPFKVYFISFLAYTSLVATALYLVRLNDSQDPRSQAQEPDTTSSPQGPEASFLTNQLLIKLSPQAQFRLETGNPQTDLLAPPEIQQTLKENQAIYLEPLVNPSAQPNEVGPINRWYLVTFSGPRMRAMAALDQVTKKLRSDNPAITHLSQVMSKLAEHSGIEDVAPNFVYTTQDHPNDTYADPDQDGNWTTGHLVSNGAVINPNYPDLWGLLAINAPGAWDFTMSDQEVVVAVIDTGVDYLHPDLVDNIWTNTDEVQNNGRDDDNNGYIDDYYGWDFTQCERYYNTGICAENPHNPDPDPMDSYGHGTHCAGTIAALTDNELGVAGVSWKAKTKIMSLRVFNRNGQADPNTGPEGYTSDIVRAIAYAIKNGAKVTSNSWGGTNPKDNAVKDAFKQAYQNQIVNVVAAGNSSTASSIADALDYTPASLDSVITVGAIKPTLSIADFSNQGPKIDVVAPGVSILSLKSQTSLICTPSRNQIADRYCLLSGTSMATPHVSGLVSLMLSVNPTLSVEAIRQHLRQSTQDLGQGGRDDTYGFGLINAQNTLSRLSEPLLVPVITSPASQDLVYNQVPIYGYIGGENLVYYKLELGSGRNPSSWSILAQGTTAPSAPSQLAVFDSTPYYGSNLTLRLTACSDSACTNPAVSQVFDVFASDQAQVYQQVVDGVTGKGVYDVKVVYRLPLTKGKSTITGSFITDSWGYYQATLPPQTYSIIYSKRGYLTKTLTATLNPATKLTNPVQLFPKTP